MYKYIVVDDEILIRRGMLKKIRAADFGERLVFAGEANNGEDALALIRSADPDIVITDMRMPEMDGKLLLQTLQQHYPHKKIIVVSGYSDYEYMKEAISAKAVGYLLKPFSREEIREALSKAIATLDAERSALEQLEHRENEKQVISYDADVQSLGHLILGLHRKEKLPTFRSTRLMEVAEAKRYVLLAAYSSDEFAPYSGQADVPYVYVPHVQQDHMALYVFYSAEAGEALLRAAAAVAAAIAAALPGRPRLGISGEKDSLGGLFEAYEETVEALNGIRVGENGPVVSAFGGGEKPAAAAEAWERMDELLFFIESGNAAKTTEWTAKLFEHYAEMPDLTLGEVKGECRLLVQEVRGLLHRNFHIDGNQSPSSSFEVALSGFFDAEAIQAYLSNVLPSIAEMMNGHNLYSSEQVVDNIKAYIHNNSNKVLTLDKISSLFFLNPSYCSFLFKEKTGINFIDYVNQVRIDKAKALLGGTDDKVYKIAKSLGYDNTKYFFRVFKKLTGFTPEEYRTNAAKASAEGARRDGSPSDA
jgi:two-component system response regulator YesN